LLLIIAFVVVCSLPCIVPTCYSALFLTLSSCCLWWCIVPCLALLFVWFITPHLVLLLLVVMSHACLVLLLVMVHLPHLVLLSLVMVHHPCLVLLLLVVVCHSLPCVAISLFHTFFKYSTHLLISLSLVLLLLVVVCCSLPCVTTTCLLRWCTFPLPCASSKAWNVMCHFKKIR
jgi:hypothetical protein